jgi:hypothetical protein
MRGLGELEATIMDRMWSYRFLERLTPEEAAALESALRVYPPKGRQA